MTAGFGSSLVASGGDAFAGGGVGFGPSFVVGVFLPFFFGDVFCSGFGSFRLIGAAFVGSSQG